MNVRSCRAVFAVWVGTSLLSARSSGAGSGFNTLVVVNQASTNSMALGNYYAERRNLPPLDVVRVSWTGGNVSWSRSDFNTVLLSAVTNAIATRGLSNQIDDVVLSMDIPFRITDGNSVNSTTAAMFYGFKDDTNRTGANPCTLPDVTTNNYVGAEASFRQSEPGSFPNHFLCTMITADTLAQAKAIVDSGVTSDATFPTNSIWLEKTTDAARNVRFLEFDNAEFDFRVSGSSAVLQTNSNQTSGLDGLLGLQTGLANLSVSSNAFVPGAIADSLTSYGGVIFGPNGQTSLLAFTDAGAAGAYGTVVEPCNYLEKFPSPLDYFYQLRGFSLAECYYLSLTNPYMGLIVGEPLAAPFAKAGMGNWVGLSDGAVLSGTTNLEVQFMAADDSRPLQRVDLFVDGRFAETLTNIPPAPGNRVEAVVDNLALDYTVKTGDTMLDVAAGLANVFNRPINQNLLSVDAAAHGDRIELKSTDVNRSGADTTSTVASSANTASTLTTFIRASRTNFLDTSATGRRQYTIGVGVVPDDYLVLDVTKTNGSTVTVAITNTATSVTLLNFLQSLLDKINASPDLQGADGIRGEDLLMASSNQVAFYFRPRTAGWPAARVQTRISGTFDITPATTVRLDENLSDLEPRNHLYISAGVTNLDVSFAWDTTQLSDGWHELTAIAYEGSHVQTQTRTSRLVRLENNGLSATFTSLLGATNTVVGVDLPFLVEASTDNVDQIELFGTGGLLAGISNQTSVSFSVPGSSLGPGLHPFYAVVSAGGLTYRTETKYLRLFGEEDLVSATLDRTPMHLLQLSWPAVGGRDYEVLSTTNLSFPFEKRDSVTATNDGTYHWIETNHAPQQFYRIQLAP